MCTMTQMVVTIRRLWGVAGERIGRLFRWSATPPDGRGLVGDPAGRTRRIGASVLDGWRGTLCGPKQPQGELASAYAEDFDDGHLDRYAAEQRELLAAEKALGVHASYDARMLVMDPSQPEFWDAYSPKEADALLGCPE